MQSDGLEQTLARIRESGKADITTPTGKELEVCYDSKLSRFVIIESGGYDCGDSAKSRLKNVLRNVGTECNIQPEAEEEGSGNAE